MYLDEFSVVGGELEAITNRGTWMDDSFLADGILKRGIGLLFDPYELKSGILSHNVFTSRSQGRVRAGLILLEQ